jgi:hypothetical protein
MKPGYGHSNCPSPIPRFFDELPVGFIQYQKELWSRWGVWYFRSTSRASPHDEPPARKVPIGLHLGILHEPPRGKRGPKVRRGIFSVALVRTEARS